jgi:sugar phosphate isomerase/epimerase
LQWPDPADITISYHSLAGNRHGEPPVNGIRARAAAIKAAGLKYLGACTEDFRDENDVLTTSRWLDSAGVRIGELEWLELSGPRNEAAEDLAMTAARILRPQRINVGYCATTLPDMADVTARLTDIGLRAMDVGADVAFEPVAFGAIGAITEVQDVINHVNLPNVGTLLDTWQLARSAWTPSVELIDPSLVMGVQLCGVDAPPRNGFPNMASLFMDAQCARRLPHEGDFPVREWVAALLDAGVTAPFAVEVISDELRAHNVRDAAQMVSASLTALTPVKEPVVA